MKRPAFTLIELLIVITIIAMLAGMSLIVVQNVQETARRSATETTLRKLDDALGEIYEQYQDLRVDGTTPAIRLANLYERMMIEMPTNLDEIRYNIATSNNALQKAYNSKVGPTVTPASFNVSANNPSAKCLFLIVTNANPEAREMFTQKEIATDESDGLQYFIDGWGNPISFIRWAPGFMDSERQPNIAKLAGLTVKEQWTFDSSDTTNFKQSFVNEIVTANKNRPDPLDPLSVGVLGNDPVSGDDYYGWLLFPLIFSAGPDGVDDLLEPTGNAILNPFMEASGFPGTNNQHQDNIHTHRLGRR